MTKGTPSATSEVFGGSARVFAAEAIALPTALVTAGFLTRQLGASGYGLFTLTLAIVAWLEWTLSSLFARAAVKLVADADDWRSAGAVVLRMFAVGGLVGCAALWLAARPLAALMHEPLLVRYLRLLAIDVPVFLLAQAHQQVLVGTGAYTRRATVAACRWTARMVFVVALVAAGFSIEGALAGILGASVVELMVARRFIQPSLRGARATDARVMWTYALPLFGAAVSLRLFDKLDLFALKALGGSAALAGVYGAAQNLTIIPGLVALSVTTLLLSTLSRSLRTGDDAGARELTRNAMRGVLLLFPFAGVAAGAATGVATLIFGAEFAGTGPLLAVLIFGAMAMVMISVASAVVTAAGRASWTLFAALPVAPLALAGHLVAIPRFGAAGAAAVTTAASALGALLALVAVHRAWGLLPPPATALRALAATVLVTVLGLHWDTAGAMVVVEVGVLSLVAVVVVVALGELSGRERATVLALVARPARAR